MKKLIFFVFVIVLQFQSYAQNDSITLKNDSSETKNSDIVLSYTNHMPTFKTKKYKDFSEYVVHNLKYPKEAEALQIQGVVYVQYTIEKDGSVSNVHVLTGKGLSPSCDKEAIDVITASPKWEPGRHNDELVRIKMIQAIKYSLTNAKRKH